VKQVPCPEQVSAALDFLVGLGISDAADLGPLVCGFPEVLGLRVEVMQENVDVLKKKWFLKVGGAHSAVMRGRELRGGGDRACGGANGLVDCFPTRQPVLLSLLGYCRAMCCSTPSSASRGRWAISLTARARARGCARVAGRSFNGSLYTRQPIQYDNLLLAFSHVLKFITFFHSVTQLLELCGTTDLEFMYSL
jgi:hypothetical protein